MSTKLQEITDKLYKEGIQKVRGESRAIISDAREQEKIILQEARKEAGSILNKAREEAQALKERTDSEITLAARQAEITLKERITNMLSNEILSSGSSDALSEKELLASMIQSSLSVWAADGNAPDVAVLSGEDDNFRKSLAGLLKKRLDAPIPIKFSENMKNKSGFRLEAIDGSCSISFSDADFQEFFRSFFRDETRRMLFGDS